MNKNEKSILGYHLSSMLHSDSREVISQAQMIISDLPILRESIKDYEGMHFAEMFSRAFIPLACSFSISAEKRVNDQEFFYKLFGELSQNDLVSILDDFFDDADDVDKNALYLGIKSIHLPTAFDNLKMIFNHPLWRSHLSNHLYEDSFAFKFYTGCM